jgi:hypothetical protein
MIIFGLMETTDSRPTTTDFQPTVIELDGSGLNDIASFKLLTEYWHNLTTQAQLDLIVSVLIRDTRIQKPSIRIFPELSEELVINLHALGFSIELSDDLMFVVSWKQSTIKPKPRELDMINEFMKHLPVKPPRPANFSSKILPLDK